MGMDSPIIPDLTALGNKDGFLTSSRIDTKLQSDVIKTTYLKQEDEVKYPAYMIDIRGCGPLNPSVLETLKRIVNARTANSDNNEVSVYMLTGDQYPREYIGAGDGMILYKILSLYLSKTIPGSVVYYGKSNKSFGKLRNERLNNVRLNL